MYAFDIGSDTEDKTNKKANGDTNGSRNGGNHSSKDRTLSQGMHMCCMCTVCCSFAEH